jgi:type III pantothenate kinase
VTLTRGSVGDQVWSDGACASALRELRRIRRDGSFSGKMPDACERRPPLLAIDVGNTNAVFGLYRGEQLLETWRIATRRETTRDEYGIILWQFFAISGHAPADVQAIAIASVVPPTLQPLMEMCEKYFKRRPLVVGPGIKTGISIFYDNPREVGADRIVNAVAAFEKYRTAVVVVDFGPATTFDCVSERGEYLGGVIAPGIGISVRALFQRASKLRASSWCGRRT